MKRRNNKFVLRFNETRVCSIEFLSKYWKQFGGVGALLLSVDYFAELLSLFKEYFGWYFYVVQNQLYSHHILNLWLTCVFIICFIAFGKQINRNKHVTFFRLFFYVIFLHILYSQHVFRFVDSAIPMIKYDLLLEMGFFFLCWIDIRKCIVRKKQKTGYLTGFTTAYVSDESLNPIRESYAKSLVRQLVNVDTSKEAFAVGVFGGWGTGKTSFLYDMIKEISKVAYCVGFNPWNCQTPQQIVTDFFGVLNDGIAPYYSPIERSVAKYVRELSGACSNAVGKHPASRRFFANFEK